MLSQSILLGILTKAAGGDTAAETSFYKSLCQEMLSEGLGDYFGEIQNLQYSGAGSDDDRVQQILANCVHLYSLGRDSSIAEVPETTGGSGDSTWLEVMPAKEVWSHFMRLPSEFRAMFSLYYVEGANLHEAARLTGYSESTCSRLLEGAKAMFLHALPAHCKMNENMDRVFRRVLKQKMSELSVEDISPEFDHEAARKEIASWQSSDRFQDEELDKEEEFEFMKIWNEMTDRINSEEGK